MKITSPELKISEHVHQERVVNWLEQRDIVFFAVPNANILLNMLPKHRQFSVQRHMVAEGMRAGVPDLIILSRPNLFGGLADIIDNGTEPISDIELVRTNLPVITTQDVSDITEQLVLDSSYFQGIEFKGIALEMKKIKAKNHKLPCSCMTDEQLYWKDKFENNGWIHILAHGSEDAIEQLERLGF